jgi:integrase
LLGTTPVLLNVRFLVFTTRTGRAIEPRAVSRRFDLRCAKAGVRRIRVHDTRRTCGLLLAALDVHPGVAMQILRRSKITITMEIYTMVPDRQTRGAQTTQRRPGLP